MQRTLEVAGTFVALLVEDGELDRELARRLGGFARSGPSGRPDLALEVVLDPTLGEPGRGGLAWGREEGGSLRVEGEGLEARIDLEAGRGRAHLGAASGRAVALGDVTENLLRGLVARLLWDRGRVLLHAAALVGPDGYSRVLVAPSGGGKSTAARVAAGAGWPNLGDDLVAIGPEADGVRVHATPFSGGERPAGPRVAPVAGLYLLEKAPAPERLPVDLAQAVAALVAATPFVEVSAADRVLAFHEGLVRRLPVARLRLAAEPSFHLLLAPPPPQPP
ncbi:MAG: hypothetical protein HY722_17015, partial [Planctomycetes bacterium]|nr:hypothetical protein [Planctomycetota bacterium]